MEKKLNTKDKIKELIYSSGVALAHHEINDMLNKSCDRVTIYRALDKLSEEGIIHKIIDVDGVSKYAACYGCTQKHHHNHVHFSCFKCNTVVCINEVKPKFELPEGYAVKDMNIMLSGLCPDCSGYKKFP
ncbi:MAG: Fur family transcriptional regulator [Prolixibacteraceae bacterium]